MIEVGRVCCKIAGRDADKICVVVDTVNENFVIIDGDVRRKKCNIKHLEPLDQVIKINKNESTAKVQEALKKAGFEIDKKGKTRVKKPRPKKHKIKKTKQRVIKEEKPKKVEKEEKKEK